MTRNKSIPFSARKRLIAAAISACFASAPAWANPTGAQVVNGSASIVQAGKLLTVTNSNGAIINWNSFSIGASETTRFNQTSASSGVLNRVLANDPSVLLGTLSSNGKVWLVNPAGILVGAGARIDVAGFIASTLNVRNEDFLAGRLNFQATPNAGKVENRGQITTPSGGSVYLVAPNVENHGTISAPDGEVMLVAGQRIDLLDTGTPGVKVEVVGAEGNATNLGTIAAEAGRIGIAGVLVKNSGNLNASSVVKQGGRVFLKASQDAYVDGAGRIVATGTKGGSIEVLGSRVAVTDQAQLDASGTSGGGQILVGGDLQGKNPEVQNASITYFGPQASLKADALQSGNGGKVIVWADDTTRAYGSISARGGSNGGDGGFVETSGHRQLDFRGTVNTGAPKGKSGTLLLDPADVNIAYGGGAASDLYTDVYGGSSAYGGPGVFGGATSGPATLYWETIDAQLSSTNVVVTTSGSQTGTSGNISVLDSYSYNRDRDLSLLAHNNITASGVNVVNAGRGSIKLTAGWDGVNASAPGVTQGIGDIALASSRVQTYGGAVSLTAGRNILADTTDIYTIGSSASRDGGAVTIVAGGNVGVGNIHTSGYSVGCVECGDSGNAGNVSVGSRGAGSITLGDVTMRGGDSYGYTPGRGGTLSIASNSATTITAGAIVADGGDVTGGYSSSIAGHGGGVIIHAPMANVSLGSISARGGDGYTTAYGGGSPGGAGGHVDIQAASFSSGGISVRGGDGGDGGEGYPTGGSGGTVTIAGFGGNIGITGDIDASGGVGGDGNGYSNGYGGSGGNISISSTGTISLAGTGNITTQGGDGGEGRGGNGGTVSLASSGGTIQFSSIDASGGNSNVRGDITLTADTLDLASSSIYGDTVTLQPTASAALTRIGAGGPGADFKIAATSIDSEVSELIIGRRDGTGDIDLQEMTWNTPVTIRSPGNGSDGGTITLNGKQTNQGRNFTLIGGAIAGSGEIDTRSASDNGGNITVISNNSGGIVVSGKLNASSTAVFAYGGNVSLYALGGNLAAGDIETSGFYGGHITLFANGTPASYGGVALSGSFTVRDSSNAYGGDLFVSDIDGVTPDERALTYKLDNGDIIINAAGTINITDTVHPTDSNVIINSSGGDIAFNSSIQVHGGLVSMRTANGNISTEYGGAPGSVTTRGGDIWLRAIGTSLNGKILGGGSLNANGDNSTNRRNGGSINLVADGLINYSGNISADGAYSNDGGAGGNGGHILIRSHNDSVTLTGNTISAIGGDGGDGGEGGLGSAGTAGGNGGSISLAADSGQVTIGSGGGIDASGGDGGGVYGYGATGGDGGRGGKISIGGATGVTIQGAYVYANGGHGGEPYDDGESGGSSGGNGGSGGSIVIASQGGSGISIISDATVAANGGDGGYGYRGDSSSGFADGGNGGNGGDGGNISVTSYGGGLIEIIGSSLDANGGNGDNGGQGDGGYDGESGGNGGNGGNGGDGGKIIVKSDGGGSIVIQSDDLNANGGDGDHGGEGYPGYQGGSGGSGGRGGTIELWSSGAITVDGGVSSDSISASGGRADRGGDAGGGTGGRGGDGGTGGTVTISASGDITMYGGNNLIVAQGRDGGDAGDGGEYGGVGGRGGDGGAIAIESSLGSITLTKSGSGWVLSAFGGTGGVGGYGDYAAGDGGRGGAGGKISVIGSSVTLNSIADPQGTSIAAGAGAGGDGGNSEIEEGLPGAQGSAFAPGESANVIIVATGVFDNNAGADALSTAGRWLIYSGETNSTLFDAHRGGLAYDFRQYGTAYGDFLQGSGSGFIYALAPEPMLTGNFTKTYDGNALADLAAATYSLSSNLDGDIVPFSSNPTRAIYHNKNVGAGKMVEVSAFTYKSVDGDGKAVYFGAAPPNYAVAAIGTINKAALTVTAPTVIKTYDGTTSASGAAAVGSLAGVAAGEAVNTAAILAFADKNAGTGKTVKAAGLTIKDGANADVTANYDISYVDNLVSVIDKAALTVTAPTVTKTYDGTTNASGTAAVASLAGAGAGDVVNTAAGLAYTDKNAGTGKTVKAAGLTIKDSANADMTANYTISYVDNLVSVIDKAALTASGITAANKVYDGTTSASLSGGSLSGLIGSDVVGVSGTGAFADKNVGVAKTVNVSSVTLTGADAGNYTLSGAALTAADITVRPLSTWIGGAAGEWSVATNWDALPDLSNVLAVTVPTGTTVTYDAAAGTTNLTSLTTGGLNITGGSLNIANSLTVNSSFSQSGGTLGDFGAGSSANITQAAGDLDLPAITVADLSLKATAGAITQSGPITALTLKTRSQGATTLTNPDNQVSGRVDMTAGGPLKLSASGDLTLGVIDAGANEVEIKAGGAILQALGTEASTNIIASLANLTSVFGGASGGLAISTNTQITGALTATVGAEADFGGIRIQNSGAQPASVTLVDNALAGAGVSFLNTGNISSTSGYTLQTLTGGDVALLSNGNLTWDGGSLATPSGSVLMSADGNLDITGALSSPVDLALSSVIAINVNGSVITQGTGTAAFTAPSVAINGSVDAADDVGIIANTINFGAGSSTAAGHDVILAAANVLATNASVAADRDISAAVTGELRLNGSSFTAGNDIFINMLGASSTLYLNDTAGLPPSFLWAQAPSTVHVDFPARASGGLVVDGVAVDPLKFVTTAGGSGLFFGATQAPATIGAGLELAYTGGTALPDTAVEPTVVDAVVAAISAVTTPATQTNEPQPSPTIDVNALPSTAAGGTPGAEGTGGTEGTFGGSGDAKKDEEEDKDKNKKDEETGLKKQADKPAAKKLATCS